MSEAFDQVRRESDPVTQARLATELIATYQQRSVELARLRRDAIERAVAETGLTFSAVAQQVGLSKGRVTQIRQGAPPTERRLFGVGPVTVAVPVREVAGRLLGAIAAEDSESADLLTDYLIGLQFQVRRYPIPVGGVWQPPADTIAICGPKSSPVTGEAITSDPFLSFEPDDTGTWAIRDRMTGETMHSGMDQGDQTSDTAYLGRLAYQGQTILVIAGVHALGSLGAVHYLTRHAADLWAEAGTSRFSTVVQTEFDGVTPVSHTLLTPVRIHE